MRFTRSPSGDFLGNKVSVTGAERAVNAEAEENGGRLISPRRRGDAEKIKNQRA
jgi:hypothetical protein